MQAPAVMAVVRGAILWAEAWCVQDVPRAAWEGAMAPSRQMPLITLGWQSWSVLVVVLTVALLTAVYIFLQ
jgi:hypothetical protein